MVIKNLHKKLFNVCLPVYKIFEFKENKYLIYGSKEEPLCLALTQQAELQLKDSKNHKIYTKIPNGVTSIKFKLLNFEEGIVYVSGSVFATACIVDGYVVVKLDSKANNDNLVITLTRN